MQACDSPGVSVRKAAVFRVSDGRQTALGDFPAATPSRPGASTAAAKFKLPPATPPELVQIGGSSGAKEEQPHVFGVGPADFLHSLQLQIFLKKAVPGQQRPLPVLKTPVASGVPVELERKDAETLIRRSVILTCVDCGYETASESCLNLLTASCVRFIQKICAELSSHRVSQPWSSVRDDDYMYQLLDEIGFSVPTLHHFVKSISERKHERLIRVNRMYGPVADCCVRPVHINGQRSDISQMIVGLEAEAAPAAEEKMWDQSLEDMSQMTDEEIMQTLMTD